MKEMLDIMIFFYLGIYTKLRALREDFRDFYGNGKKIYMYYNCLLPPDIKWLQIVLVHSLITFLVFHYIIFKFI